MGGPAFEPLDRNGLGAQFLSLEGIGWGNMPLPSADNGRRAFLGGFSGLAVAVVGCEAVSVDRT